MARKIGIAFIALMCSLAAACGGPPPPPTTPVAAVRHVDQGPPPTSSTPVPIQKAKQNVHAGRTDPFVALYGINGAGAPRRTAAAYPKIPTLPGFEGAPGGGKPVSIWDGVRIAGIVQSNGYSAIIEADGKSYVAREGDSIANNKFRVVAIGPGYVTLSSAEGVRNFSLGG